MIWAAKYGLFLFVFSLEMDVTFAAIRAGKLVDGIKSFFANLLEVESFEIPVSCSW